VGSPPDSSIGHLLTLQEASCILLTMHAALLKAARELLFQASLLVAAMEASRREAAVSALVKIETLARGLRSAVED
jgi:hypothetical protein